METTLSMSAIRTDDRRSPAPAARRVKTWHIFAIVSLLTIALTWYGTRFVLTHDVYARLRADQLDVTRIERQFALRRQNVPLQLAIVPVAVALRIGFVALCLQFLLLSGGVEARFTRIFRAVALAYPVLLLAYFALLLEMRSLPLDAIDSDTMTRMPGSIVAGIRDLRGINAGVQQLLRCLNVFEFAWLVVLFYGIVRFANVSRRAAASSALATWVLIAGLQSALVAYLARIAR